MTTRTFEMYVHIGWLTKVGEQIVFVHKDHGDLGFLTDAEKVYALRYVEEAS